MTLNVQRLLEVMDPILTGCVHEGVLDTSKPGVWRLFCVKCARYSPGVRFTPEEKPAWKES